MTPRRFCAPIELVGRGLIVASLFYPPLGPWGHALLLVLLVVRLLAQWTFITAKVQAVDAEKGTITVTTAEGKVLVLKVDKDTSIVGPRGGKSADRLKDDRLAKGSEIKIALGADGKTAKTIQLGFRKKPAKDKEKSKEKKGS